MTSPQCWDIFCSVVDNYGDAGVAWRLARQLAAEYRYDVRLFIDAVPEPKQKATRTKPRLDLSAFQAVKRDFAFVVDRTVEAGSLVRAAAAADRKLVTGVSVFDVFEGASIGEGKKSIAIEVAIQPVERTLTDEDFEALAGRIVENVKKQTGGVLRG